MVDFKEMVDSNQIEPMMTVREVAQLIHIHANTVRRWSDQGLIRTYRITNRGDRRFKREDVALFIAEFNPYRVNRKRAMPMQASD